MTLEAVDAVTIIGIMAAHHEAVLPNRSMDAHFIFNDFILFCINN